MTPLDTAITAAFESQGKQEDVNRVYLLLLKSPLFVPVKKEANTTDDEPFQPLFAKIDEQFFMLAFDTTERLIGWAGDYYKDIAYVELSGHDIVKGINEGVFLCLNYGTDFYKEFSPDEVKRLKTIVSKIEQLKG